MKKVSSANLLYRVRVGDWRVGLAVEEGVVEFVRCLHRRDNYPYFP